MFDVDGEVVWSPALRIGQLFMSMAGTLADNAGVDLPAAGFTMMASDYYYVDPPALAGFVRTLLAGSVVTHSVYKELARGFVVACLVLLERAGVSMEPSDEAQRDLFDARAALAASMSM
ncbi:DUF6086 family protein [Amycolatopsis sp. NPDC051128]|uniref:DUF6086 family protein n=1 Tax=Amycolatopsis sp. NPDC051128 TaxID=3155412 RepID=UPI003436D2C5